MAARAVPAKTWGVAIGLNCNYNGRKGMRTYVSFCDCLKLVCGCKFSGVALVRSQDGQTLRASYKEIPNRCHRPLITSLLKRPSGISDEALNEVL